MSRVMEPIKALRSGSYETELVFIRISLNSVGRNNAAYHAS